MNLLRFGPEVCGDLDEGARREWLVTDGLGGYAMGTVAGLRTRRYHGLLTVASPQPAGRHLGLVGLDPVLVLGDTRVRLSTWEWSGGTVDPAGHTLLAGFVLADGVPMWRWQVGDTVLDQMVAMVRGRPAVAVTYRLVAGGPARLELGATCTWRDVHGERFAGPDPEVAVASDGFIFEGRYRVSGPDFVPGGAWYRKAWAREEAARGLNAMEDLWHAGVFSALVNTGDLVGVSAWADRLDDPPPPADQVVDAARHRARQLVGAANGHAASVHQLVLAADQFVVEPPGADAPRVMAGYPWFMDWGRDTMTSYEGLFLATGRVEEGRRLLAAAGASVSEGMVANTADTGSTEYNSIDATLWFLHAVGRHVEVTGDVDLAASLIETLRGIVSHYVDGARYGIGVDEDGLLRGGADGVALTWMDARVDGRPVTQRAGKPVEVNALWVRGLAALAQLLTATGGDPSPVAAMRDRAAASFAGRFVRSDGVGLYDVVDGPGGDDGSVRPNQLLAVSLPDGPLEAGRPRPAGRSGGPGGVPAAAHAARTPLARPHRPGVPAAAPGWSRRP